MTAILIALIILFPWFGAVIIWLMKDEQEKLTHILAMSFSAFSAVLSLVLLTRIGQDQISAYSLGIGMGDLAFSADALGIILTCIANCIGCLAVVFSKDYMNGEKDLQRYYSMILLFIGAMSGLVLTSNAMLIFFFWEITALCSYQLISFYNDDPKAVRGGLKALFITQFGGIGLLLGSLLIFSQTGSLDIQHFIAAAQAGEISSAALAVAGFGLIAAAAAKSSQFPFFTWLPDAMEAPTPVSALIHAATMVNAGVYLLCRFAPAFQGVAGWNTTVLWVGIITILLSSVMAIFANDLKRVLAYSTVSQLGFLFAAIGAGSVNASQFHLLSHAIFKALLFLCAGAVIHSVGTRDMRLMGNLYKKMKPVAICFIIGACSLAGIPIFNGFWSKELILEAIHSGAPLSVYILMLFAVILTAIYSIRCVWMVFFGKEKSELHVHEPGRFMKYSLYVLAAGTVVSWLTFGGFSNAFSKSLPHHEIEAESLGKFLSTIIKDPLTYLAIFMVILGIVLWIFHKPGPSKAVLPKVLETCAVNSFGFEIINEKIIDKIQNLSEFSRELQSGILNWNIFGVLTGLVLILIVLGIGG